MSLLDECGPEHSGDCACENECPACHGPIYGSSLATCDLDQLHATYECRDDIACGWHGAGPPRAGAWARTNERKD